MKFLSNQRLWSIHYGFKLKYYLSFFQYLLIDFDTSDSHSWQQVFYLFKGRVYVLYFIYANIGVYQKSYDFI